MSGKRCAREGPLTQPGCSCARILTSLGLRAASRVPRQGLLPQTPFFAFRWVSLASSWIRCGPYPNAL